jgi:outer membrane biosynthesis protein TonB
MALKKIDERLSRLQNFVDNWKRTGGPSRIERDIVLEELRNLYNEVLDFTPESNENPEAEVVVAVESAREPENVEEPTVVEEPTAEESESEDVVAEPEVEDVVVSAVATTHESVGDAFDDALDIDALLGLSGDDTIEEAERAIEEGREEAAHAAEVAEVAEPEVEPVVTSVAPVASASEPVAERVKVGGLFDIDDIPVRSRRGRKMISLYDAPTKQPNIAAKHVEPVAEPVVETKVEVAVPAPVPEPTPAPAPAPIVEPTPAPAPAPTPVVEPTPQRLGDVIAKNVTTLADKMAEEQPTAAYNRITDIRKAIGLNDKFLMIRDLFGGDANLYEDTITHLNEFEDLDECMIFIVENFRWNPDSEGAKLLVSLIERKLS